MAALFILGGTGSPSESLTQRPVNPACLGAGRCPNSLTAVSPGCPLFALGVLRWAAMARRSKRPVAKSHRLKKSIYMDGDKRSISLEPFWTALEEIAANQSVRISKLVTTIDRNREHANLSSAIRLYVLHYYQRSSRK